MLETGIRGRQSVAVTPENTAKTMGSGTLNVFATPALVALAEKTCWMSVADALDEGCGSVGTKLELEHTAPTPVGMTVTCESELTAVEGRKLVFKVSLYDEKGPWAAASTSASWSTTPNFPPRPRARKVNLFCSPRPASSMGGGSAARSCCSARACASCRSRAACSLARNSSRYIAL